MYFLQQENIITTGEVVVSIVSTDLVEGGSLEGQVGSIAHESAGQNMHAEFCSNLLLVIIKDSAGQTQLFNSLS